jgi:hypothetical protein
MMAVRLMFSSVWCETFDMMSGWLRVRVRGCVCKLVAGLVLFRRAGE